MLEDQRRLCARDIGQRVEFLNDEGPQVLGVAGRDVQDVIIRARKEVHVDHLWQLAYVTDEGADLAARIGLQADRDHRL
ncbi:Uncharacterised protein [Mycobacteroides abscessus subsp. abscessus]|nr:Uncharacterised protein [Mycobacteroides abscessus subsp. abscessus]